MANVTDRLLWTRMGRGGGRTVLCSLPPAVHAVAGHQQCHRLVDVVARRRQAPLQHSSFVPQEAEKSVTAMSSGEGDKLLA